MKVKLEVQYGPSYVLFFICQCFCVPPQMQLITALSYYPPLPAPDTRNVMDTVTTQSDK